jgi:hypothetical protein
MFHPCRAPLQEISNSQIPAGSIVHDDVPKLPPSLGSSSSTGSLRQILLMRKAYRDSWRNMERIRTSLGTLCQPCSQKPPGVPAFPKHEVEGDRRGGRYVRHGEPERAALVVGVPVACVQGWKQGQGCLWRMPRWRSIKNGPGNLQRWNVGCWLAGLPLNGPLPPLGSIFGSHRGKENASDSSTLPESQNLSSAGSSSTLPDPQNSSSAGSSL